MEKLYKGIILLRDFEEGEAIYIGNDDEPLVEQIKDTMYWEGSYLSVTYYIADKKTAGHILERNYLENMLGIATAKLYCTYSDLTGYLWTTEELKVGGHDLIQELQNNEGKFLYMRIKFSKEDINKT